jgi:antitoxin component YwqK of YwqJK toxin-antitoxin module
MRNILVLIHIFLSGLIFGQTRKFMVTDTNAIRIHIHTEEIPSYANPKEERDTLYFFKDKICKEGGHFTGYYDKEFKKKAIETTYDKNGKQIGYYNLWYANGQMKEHSKDTVYFKDFIFYDITSWYPNNEIKSKEIYNGKDTASTIYFYNNGTIKAIEKEYYDASYSHPLYCYNERHFENGQLCNTPLSNNWYKTRQLVIYYFPDGKTKISCTMFLCEYIGNYQEWDENGKLILSGQYEDYPGIENEMIHAWRRPTKIGKWDYFNNKGELTREELFNDKGELIQTTNK